MLPLVPFEVFFFFIFLIFLFFLIHFSLASPPSGPFSYFKTTLQTLFQSIILFFSFLNQSDSLDSSGSVVGDPEYSSRIFIAF